MFPLHQMNFVSITPRKSQSYYQFHSLSSVNHSSKSTQVLRIPHQFAIHSNSQGLIPFNLENHNMPMMIQMPSVTLSIYLMSKTQTKSTAIPQIAIFISWFFGRIMCLTHSRSAWKFSSQVVSSTLYPTAAVTMKMLMLSARTAWYLRILSYCLLFHWLVLLDRLVQVILLTPQQIHRLR